VRVAIVFDMEGASHVCDVRETFPHYEEYWRSGRPKLTADVAAAARGLLDAGVAEVLVVNNHGGAGGVPWPNVIEDELPDGVSALNVVPGELGEHADVMLQVGRHARGGSQSFLSHTVSPGLRLRVDGEFLSESHLLAYRAGIPVIGIVGSDALERELGSLSSVPYLSVQRTSSRASVRPVFDTPAATASAIRDFSRGAVLAAADAPAHGPAADVLEVSIHNGDDGADAMVEVGWTRTSASEFRAEGSWSDLAPLFAAAVAVAFRPYGFMFTGQDVSSLEAAIGFPYDRWSEADAIVRTWALEDQADWFSPDTKRFEGMPPSC